MRYLIPGSRWTLKHRPNLLSDGVDTIKPVGKHPQEVAVHPHGGPDQTIAVVGDPALLNQQLMGVM